MGKKITIDDAKTRLSKFDVTFDQDTRYLTVRTKSGNAYQMVPIENRVELNDVRAIERSIK